MTAREQLFMFLKDSTAFTNRLGPETKLGTSLEKSLAKVSFKKSANSKLTQSERQGRNILRKIIQKN